MFILGELIIVIANGLSLLLSLYELIVITSVILSWIKPALNHPTLYQVSTTVEKLTAPLYNLLKRLPFPLVYNGLDFTPMAAWFAVHFANSLVSGVILRIGRELSFG